jgi:pantothenate kinase
LLARLQEEQRAVLWPAFHREVDEPTPDEIAIPLDTKLVIAEGNYLLLEQPCWQHVRPLLDDIWYVDAPLEVLRARLLQRAMAYGRSEEKAMRHVDGSDMRNARLVARTSERASRTIQTH